MVDRVARLNSDLPDEWGALYGLKLASYSEHPRSLEAIIDGRKAGLVERVRALTSEHEQFLFDHPRVFENRRGGKALAVVFAPYQRASLGKYGSTGTVNALAHSIAAELDLYVRVAHPADTIYLSNFDDDPTVPLVWWNPDRIDLPYPEIDDPNPGHSSRMES